ncbi:3'- 5' exonuclease domain protein [Mariniradius saccharolyticus AK6]|uniref:3'-5' exonuclease n=1 Tax=Mariniradius saccharolyticus AK6 TaxID=1239962 RepID=M7X7F8_9BACT|nr:3'-5' exonuclease [Mariniradius saccharolyticus]EMS30899.1 3'- 5' exonuclease domain protein [Mariniradius saccharolyticus AK6]
MIPLKISKTEINELPMGQFEGDIVLVDRMEQVREVLDEIERHKHLGFDTETKPSFTKGTQHKVALMQLATEDIAFLIRINQIGVPEELLEVLQSRSVTKIGAAVLDDLRALQKIKRGFVPGNFFDLNDELKKVGFQNVGVRNLAAMVLNMRISKSEQVSNWEASTLTEKQMVYAATDAWACLQVFKKLEYQGYLESLIK